MTRQPFPFTLTPESDDQRFMLAALKEAWKSFQQEEVPVGAVIVVDGAIIARGSNQVEMLQDATAHAEMLAITSAEAALQNWRLQGATLYCTLEPCPMCAGAAILSRVERIVWGAPDIRQGANGSWTDLFASKHPIHQIKIEGGVYASESAELLRAFFKKRREEKDRGGRDNGFIGGDDPTAEERCREDGESDRSSRDGR